jgi:hypothetical protein
MNQNRSAFSFAALCSQDTFLISLDQILIEADFEGLNHLAQRSPQPSAYGSTLLFQFCLG